MSQDLFHRFLFEAAGMRGELVQMAASWQAVTDKHHYPDDISSVLGHALTATLLMSGTLKAEGSLILQAKTDGIINSLIAQADHNRIVRGLARWEQDKRAQQASMLGNGQLVMTIEQAKGQRYQGVIPVDNGATLAATLEHYFIQSEQLQTRFWLAADNNHAAGLMIQELPDAKSEDNKENRNRIIMLAETITDEELLTVPAEQLLHRLFHEEDVRLFEPEPVIFRCHCSTEKVESTIQLLGQAEAEDIIKEQGSIGINCEFCNREYRYDAVDIAKLFSASIASDSSQQKH